MSGFKSSRDVAVDGKGRVTIPAMFRDIIVAECSGELTITRHLHASCLVVYKRPDWEKIEADLDRHRDATLQYSTIVRRILGFAEDLDVDTNGRILIPKGLRMRASIEKTATVSGLGNLLEIWNPDLLEEASAQPIDSSDPETARLTKLLRV